MVTRVELSRVGFWLGLVAFTLILAHGSQGRAFAQTTFGVDGPCGMTRAAQLPIEFVYKGTIPTGFDGINRATCTFTKPVEKVTVTLSGPAEHTEVFTLAEPSTEVPFPLPEGTLSITTLEIVPPGEYQREITATSVDGETLVISELPEVLKTVTILETPVEAPSVGDFALSDRTLAGAAVLALILIGFGTAVIAITRPN